jgi:hypothetical protein
MSKDTAEATHSHGGWAVRKEAGTAAYAPTMRTIAS